ncbi:MAG: transporter substrate-binding domain-containing protein [Rhodobacterales bacterium]|nr:transporter substrate-binding domain-containing protein [Rhodobacterales bacterium]
MHRRTTALAAGILMALLAGLCSLPAWAEPLLLVFESRPPYYVLNSAGELDGVVLGPIARALENAGIEFLWVERSSKRQMEDVRRNTGPVCSPGWFKKPERELFAKFSAPVYQDRPQVMVTRPDVVRAMKAKTLAGLFQEGDWSLGVKKGYSYGTYIDELRATTPPRTVETTQDMDGMVRMLLGRRFDYFISTPEELWAFQDRSGDLGDKVVSASFTDIPAGNWRYLMCSQMVDDDILIRFNRGLAARPQAPRVSN